MAGDEDFELCLGHIGDRSGGKPFLHRVRRAANLAGGIRPAGTRSRRFDGSRIGRGAGVGRVLASSDRFAGPRARRVVVKARIVRLAGKGAAGAVAHLRYLQRDGTTREGERGSLYGAERDAVDGKAFLERGKDDRHQFRFIVAPEDGADYDDLKPLVRRLMEQAGQDLGTPLDWVAVDHFNTGHPHAHLIVRGKDDRGKDLVIAREYLTQGLRMRAAELVNLDLGPRTDREIMASRQREIGQERFTTIDRRMVASIDADGLVSARHRDPAEQALRAARLRTLERMALAREEGRGRWRLDPELEPVLRRMGMRGDIIRTMSQAMRERLPERSPVDYALFDPAGGTAEPIVGRVVLRGLSDEHADRHYLIVDGIDGRSHYVDIGHAPDAIPENAILRIMARPVEPRDVDRTVAAIAAAHEGRYNVDIHLRHDRMASQAFAEAHIRRLEAIRRATGGVEREPDGTWVIAPDHLARAQAYEHRQAERTPVLIETLSERPLALLPEHDGATWLDHALVAREPADLGRGFGAEVRQALDRRRQWLVAQQLAIIEDETTRYRPDLVEALRRREFRRVAGQLSRELGLAFTEAAPGEAVEGIYRRPVQVGDQRFALIERSREFTLVPWRPVLERELGQTVSGIVREGGVSWTIGRSRGLGIG
ncbi:relaxase/mobilization nuclease RlxS [Flavisphingomonas formosensis]|uniref:relaxase/mobilization nuclease RlxS n=1 Tax=Flavisphingomonas formosensis TaxID=861534 RepID=UPI0012F820F0|nr:relaxase/mobilization nuclease RlxS [Sphingomonas formosensis]